MFTPMAVGGDGSSLEQIHFLISRSFYLTNVWLEARLQEVGLAKHLKPGMGPILFCLLDRDDVTMIDLVERTGLVASTISRTIKAMRASGVVSVRRDKADARAVRVRLTPLGRSLEPRCRSMATEINSILLGGTDPQDADIMRDGLKTIVENLKRQVR
jgi:MarR family transcriptional regulator, organic hydroperoxide resistance regulator